MYSKVLGQVGGIHSLIHSFIHSNQETDRQQDESKLGRRSLDE